MLVTLQYTELKRKTADRARISKSSSPTADLKIRTPLQVKYKHVAGASYTVYIEGQSWAHGTTGHCLKAKTLSPVILSLNIV